MTRRTVKKTIPTYEKSTGEVFSRVVTFIVLLALSFVWLVSLIFGAISIITTSVAIVAGTLGVAVYHGKFLLLFIGVFIISTLIIQAICRNTWKDE